MHFSFVVILKDVRARESAMELNTVVNPLLPFPCTFQVATDKIIAFEQVTMQDFDAIFLPLKCSESFSTSTFVEIVQAMGGRVPKMFYMVAHDDVVDARRESSIVRLTPDASIPLNDLVRAITSAVMPLDDDVLPIIAAENLPQPVHVSVPAYMSAPVSVAAQHRASAKRKRARAHGVQDHHAYPASRDLDPQQQMAAYHHYLQAMHMHQQWLAQSYAPTTSSGRDRRTSKSPRHKHTPSEVTSESIEGFLDDGHNVDAPAVVTASSDADDAFECSLEGFDDMYSFLMDETVGEHTTV
jgi:hypothetical protein